MLSSYVNHDWCLDSYLKTPIGRFNPALYRVERDALHLVLASHSATQLFVGRKQAEGY